MNVTVLSGRLTKDPELRYVGDGKAVVNFTIANNDGTEPLFINCTAWDKTAELIAERLRRASKVSVQGQLVARRWEKGGQKHEVTEIRAVRVDFPDPAPTDGAAREDMRELDALPF